MPLSAAKIEDNTLASGILHQDKCHLSPSIFIYLLLSSCSKNKCHLPPSIFM